MLSREVEQFSDYKLVIGVVYNHERTYTGCMNFERLEQKTE